MYSIVSVNGSGHQRKVKMCFETAFAPLRRLACPRSGLTDSWSSLALRVADAERWVSDFIISHSHSRFVSAVLANFALLLCTIGTISTQSHVPGALVGKARVVARQQSTRRLQAVALSCFLRSKYHHEDPDPTAKN